MKNIKPYAKYKTSGIAWLGDIPEHWEVKRIKYVFQEQDKRSETGLEDLLSVSHFTGVTKKSDRIVDGELMTTASTLVGYKIVNEGDLVINIMLAWNGSLGISKYKGITSPAYCVYKSLIGGEKYFGYLFRTKNAQQEFKTQSTGIIDSRLRLYSDKFFKIKTAIPPFSEQTAIANFLDYKTAKIDRFIAKKKQLIKLLNEQKSAIINDAVTKGLNPNVKMKPSGIEWLGDIPEHWEVRKLKYLSQIVRGASPRPAGDPKLFGGSIPWVTVGEITKDKSPYLTETRTFLTAEGAKESRLIKKSTLVITNSGATLGVPKIFLIDGCINDGVVAFQGINENYINKLFIYYILDSFTKKLRTEMNQGSTQPNLNTSILGNIVVPFMQKEEQDLIVSHIEKETAKLNQTIATIEKEITLVQEYRTALIAEAVTGKIDVRDYEIAEVLEENTYEDWEQELNIAAEEEAEYHKQEME